MFDKFINELILNNIFSFKDDQILMMNKIPFVIFPARAMAKFIQTTSEDIGVEELSKIAYDAGMMVANEFVEKFVWNKVTLPGKKKMVFKMFEVMGFGKLEVKKWNSKKNEFLVNILFNPTIEKGKFLYGNKSNICSFYMAIYSAHLHNEFGIDNCKLIETQCVRKGAKFCEWSYNVFKDKKDISRE